MKSSPHSFIGIYIYKQLPFCISVEDAKRKWKNLTDGFKKCLDRERDQGKSGAAYSKTPTCRLYKELLFLRDVISNRSTASNIINVVVPPGTPASCSGEMTVGQCSSVSSMSSSPVISASTTPVDEESPTGYVNQTLPKYPATQQSILAVPTRPGKRQKKNDVDPVDQLLINALSNESPSSSKTDDADTHFCLSLVEVLKSLAPKRNLIIKSKIMMLVSETLED